MLVNRKGLFISILFCFIFTANSFASSTFNFSKLQRNSVLSSGVAKHYPCFIRVDRSDVGVHGSSCSGNNCRVSCNSVDCLVIAGTAEASPVAIPCSIKIDYSDNSSYTFTNDPDSVSPVGAPFTHDVSSANAKDVCGNDFSVCAYWKHNSGT